MCQLQQHNETLDPRIGFSKDLLDWSLKHYAPMDKSGYCYIDFNLFRRSLTSKSFNKIIEMIASNSHHKGEEEARIKIRRALGL